MGSFTTVIDGRDQWQIKTGNDDAFLRLKIGDPVPYRKNEAMALDVEFPDGVYGGTNSGDGASSGGPHNAWVIIKDHKIHGVASWEDNTYSDLMVMFGIRSPGFCDWEAEAQIAYHEKKIADLRSWIERRNKIAAECGDPDWHRKPGAHLRLKLREEGLVRQILPPA